jgi:indole-3-glycerol phosphate synthase
VNELERIVERTRGEVASRREAVPLASLESWIDGGEPRRPFREALAGPGLSLIAEHKRRSPSAGVISEGAQLEDVVGAYERAGASALSVLTEEHGFGGSLDDLGRARRASSLPVLRKDFIVDEYQVVEALTAGADAVLLIVAALDGATLTRLHALAGELGLGVLVEVHDAAELAAAADLGATVIGINNRDLTTLKVDTGRTFELRPRVPEGALVVAESGFRTRAELERLAAAGVDAVLVGEALMRAPDIESACRDLAGVAAGGQPATPKAPAAPHSYD